jgi:TRAP-type C4-dicarboxylate transport system permease large subunit
MCGITRISMSDLIRSAWPFIVLQYVVLGLCMVFPDLVTWLPRYLGF